jgi:hemerythrin
MERTQKEGLKGEITPPLCDKMVFIEWNDNLSVGIKKIDDQHKKFISMLNKVGEATQSGKSIDLSKQTMELMDFARIHFSTEEDLFDKYSYPGSNEHKLEHLKLLEKAIKFNQRVQVEKGLQKELFEFLKEWLENHLKKYDFKYAKYFAENKIKVQ